MILLKLDEKIKVSVDVFGTSVVNDNNLLNKSFRNVGDDFTDGLFFIKCGNDD